MGFIMASSSVGVITHCSQSFPLSPGDPVHSLVDPFCFLLHMMITCSATTLQILFFQGSPLWLYDLQKCKYAHNAHIHVYIYTCKILNLSST